MQYNIYFYFISVYKEEKGTLFRINEVINEEIAHTNSKMSNIYTYDKFNHKICNLDLCKA